MQTFFKNKTKINQLSLNPAIVKDIVVQTYDYIMIIFL